MTTVKVIFDRDDLKNIVVDILEEIGVLKKGER